MATLNIKNFPKGLYESLRKRAKRERRSLAQEIIRILSKTAEEDRLHSILELRGLGKEIWRGIDTEKYIREERNSWDD